MARELTESRFDEVAVARSQQAPGSSAFTVRRANLDNRADQRAVVALLDMYAREPMGMNAPLPERIRQELVPGLKKHPTSLIFLAWDEQTPVGVAVCFRGFSTFQARPLLNIHDLAVLPECRGQGVGRALLRAVEQEARRTACCRLTLEVRDDNKAAQHVYLRAGFNPSGVLDAAYAFWTKSLDQL
jgi:ribosomal protein S18 acetylase RimI-like enzyme